jgi:transposase
MFFLQGLGMLTSLFGIRTSWTSEQLEVLNTAFVENSYPTKSDQEQLASRLGMTAKNVYNWFRRKRETNKSKIRGLDSQTN